MTIHANDIQLRASRVMADVPEGGGGPAAQVIRWGESNTVFDDVDSVGRTVGNVSVRQAFLHVDTPNTDRLLGAYAIIAKLPADPNVNVTLAACEPFARRSQISTAIADYLIPGVPWNGFLLGNHVQGQANMQLFQRVGTPVPTVGRTLVLVVNEGQSNQRVEWVRIIKVDSETRTFTDANGDYTAQVVLCELASGLSQALPGSDPNRYHQVGAGRTTVRDTTAADAANYYGAAALAQPAELGATTLKVGSVYSQLVPSSATPVPALDQRPAAQRTILLASSPRLIEVPATPHTRRIKIGQENRGLSYVAQLTPLPEPGTIVITWVALGNRQTIVDDGAGGLTGAGAGSVNAGTGSLAITLPSLPDVGSAIVISWGERVAYTNRASQGASVRPPEYAWQIESDNPDDQVVPGSLQIGYTSGGTVYTVADDGSGQLTGAASGVIDYPSRNVLLRPTHMPDPGAEFQVDCQLDAVVTELITAPAPDAGGYIQLTLAQQPAAKSLSVQWAVARHVSNTSGGHLTTTTATKHTDVTYTVKSVPEYYEPAPGAVTGGQPVTWQPYLPDPTMHRG